jgi:CBS domain containing-hemolysin-like protein
MSEFKWIVLETVDLEDVEDILLQTNSDQNEGLLMNETEKISEETESVQEDTPSLLT